MARRVGHDTHVERLTGVVECGVAIRDIGEYFIASQVAFKERKLAQFVKATVDFFERPV
jgi:hypothetical protein